MEQPNTSHRSKREKMGVEKNIEGRECKPLTLVSPKLSVEVKSFNIKKVYINYMNCNFFKSQNETFCIEQKICLSNISYLYKATESHEY